jgi:antitoxin FitA
MATLTIRNLPDEVIEALKALARKHGRSMEEEVRRLLADQVLDRRSALEQIDRLVEQQARSTTPEEIDAALEEGRR